MEHFHGRETDHNQWWGDSSEMRKSLLKKLGFSESVFFTISILVCSFPGERRQACFWTSGLWSCACHICVAIFWLTRVDARISKGISQSSGYLTKLSCFKKCFASYYGITLYMFILSKSLNGKILSLPAQPKYFWLGTILMPFYSS